MSEVTEVIKEVTEEIAPKAAEAVIKAPNVLFEKAKGMIIGFVTGVTGTLAITKGIPAIRKRHQEKQIRLAKLEEAEDYKELEDFGEKEVNENTEN